MLSKEYDIPTDSNNSLGSVHLSAAIELTEHIMVHLAEELRGAILEFDTAQARESTLKVHFLLRGVPL